jgi:hypothetical protein
MNLLAANLLAALLSYVAAGLAAVWYVAPALNRRPLAQALTLLMWVEAFRYVALQVFSAAEVAGLTASLTAQRVIAFGDLTTAVLALLALIALRRRHTTARALVWVVAVVGTADLVSATVTGIREQLTNTASDWSWVILAFYAPVLWVVSVLTFWQLLTRRKESLRGSETVATGMPAAARG